MDSGLSSTEALLLGRENNNSMFGGGNDAWVFFLFFLLAWGGGGFGFGNNGYTNQINNDFLYTNLSNQLGRGQDRIENTLGQGFTQIANNQFNTQKDLCQGFGGVQIALSNLQHSQDSCCCTTNRNIDAVRYENAKNTCDIINAIHADGEATRALMTQNTIQELRDQLQAAQLQLGTFSQTATIINSVRPFPIPAYVTCSPYTSANTCGGCGNYVGY